MPLSIAASRGDDESPDIGDEESLPGDDESPVDESSPDGGAPSSPLAPPSWPEGGRAEKLGLPSEPEHPTQATAATVAKPVKRSRSMSRIEYPTDPFFTQALVGRRS
jgi:hypothetical protein